MTMIVILNPNMYVAGPQEPPLWPHFCLLILSEGTCNYIYCLTSEQNPKSKVLAWGTGLFTHLDYGDFWGNEYWSWEAKVSSQSIDFITDFPQV